MLRWISRHTHREGGTRCVSFVVTVIISLPPVAPLTPPPVSPLCQVVVPLVLLQVLQSKGQSLTTLLGLGLRFLEEDEAVFIIQQGGWVSLKSVVEKSYQMSILIENYIAEAREKFGMVPPLSSYILSKKNLLFVMYLY